MFYEACEAGISGVLTNVPECRPKQPASCIMPLQIIFMLPTLLKLSSSLVSHTRTAVSLLISLFSFIATNSQTINSSKLSSSQNIEVRNTFFSLEDTAHSNQNTNRQWLIAGVHLVGYGGSLILLNEAWYKGYAKTSFHTFNDSKEWLQVDKMGHAWSVYNASKVSAAMWTWAGLSNNKAAWIGALSSTAYLTGIEFLDAHSSKWGWSWSDMVANFVGSGFFVGQEALWNEQRIQYKFSFHRKNYDDPVLKKRADDLFGDSWSERMLKDYNAQTYWLSASPRSFFPKSNWPAWLNISIGYGADGMFGGFENKWYDNDPGFPIDRTDVPRKRQFYLAPDIDFTKIKTDKKWLRTVFTFLNAFKCPAPALMIDSKGKFKACAIYF